jgi:hypothetical protein
VYANVQNVDGALALVEASNTTALDAYTASVALDSAYK